MFDAQEMTYAPDPILEDGTINIELKGNWKEKGTELFGVLVTISMEIQMFGIQKVPKNNFPKIKFVLPKTSARS